MDDDVDADMMMVAGMPQDKDFIYFDIETHDDEDVRKNGKLQERDDTYSPNVNLTLKSLPSQVKMPRPKRDKAKRKVIGDSLANAAAKLENKPPPKRRYNKKKAKAKCVASEEQSQLEHSRDILVSNEVEPQPSTSWQASVEAPSSSSGTTSNVHEAIASDFNSLNNNKTVAKPQILHDNKKAKKGQATPKQRLAKKLGLKV